MMDRISFPLGLEQELFVLGEEEKLGDEDDVGVQGQVTVDGLGLVGKPRLTLDGLGEDLIFELAQVVAMRERP